ncbi:Phosphoribosyl 1,2-cyclic phosphodiesterase [Lachnospiraceae bacterium KH1T2]|nr:Phosphoribosyl 1,2-cyclic phosphodiesterase [Lachnospiraceae bacterium KH1T2]
MKLCSIASGSSGNCIYVGTGKTNLLVDAGISGKRIEAGLAELLVDAAKIDGILITHEHSDHIKGLGVITRRYGLPIYATKGTIEAMLATKDLAKTPHELIHEISADRPFELNDITINPIHISHDAADPVAYRFTSDGRSVAVMTDLGKYDEYIIDNLKGVSALLLEANHDVNMLEAGKYPYYLKQRILSDRGHLSNDTAGELTEILLSAGNDLKTVLLGHLSKENNYDKLAYETVRMEIGLSGERLMPSLADFRLMVAGRDKRSECIAV